MSAKGKPWAEVKREIAAVWEAIFNDRYLFEDMRRIHKEASRHWRDRDTEPARTSFGALCMSLALYRRERAMPRRKEYERATGPLVSAARNLRRRLTSWPEELPPMDAEVRDAALRAVARIEAEIKALAPHALTVPGRLPDGSLAYRRKSGAHDPEASHPELAAAGRWAIDHLRMWWDIPDTYEAFVDIAERAFDWIVAEFDPVTGRLRFKPHACGDSLRRMLTERDVSSWRYSDREQVAFKRKGRAPKRRT